MWPLPPINNKHVHILLHPDHVSCYWITKNKNREACIEAFQQYDIPFLSDDIIYNPTFLQQIITTFIKEHNLQYAYCHYVLHKPFIHEQLVSHTNSYAKLKDLTNQHNAHITYDYSYIGPYEDRFLFYLCSISQPLLLQLKMLHMRMPLYLQTVYSSLTTQCNLYTHVHRSRYNQTQLIQAIDQEEISIKDLFSLELLQKYIQTKCPEAYDTNLVYVIGSFLGSHYETD